MKTLMRGGQVFHQGQFRRLDVVLEDGVLVKLFDPSSADPSSTDAADSFTPKVGGVSVIDIDGKFVLPGLADVHVHLREPGFSYKETIRTGTAAAASGGFTTVCAMPNLDPAPDNVEELARQISAYDRDALVEVFPYACLTSGGTGRGELLDYTALAPEVVGFSDDGFGVQFEEKMRRIMELIAPTGGIIAQHCEDLELSGDGYINDGDYARANGHLGKPGISEWSQLERDLKLVEETGCNYHACHLSTIRSVELVREAKAKGLPVTAESAPHYLALWDDLLEDDGRFRMNPPIRSRADYEVVAEALVDGTIDMVATDHAPHSAEEKSKGLRGSANGVVGLEISAPVIYTHFVKTGRIAMEDFVRIMCTAGRERFKLGGGLIEEGEKADLIVFDPEYSAPVDPSLFQSKGRATPFAGAELYGRVDLTICQGTVVWDLLGVDADGTEV